MTPKTSAAEARLDTWQQAATAELQDLVQVAANIRTNITTAKTQTKKQYFEKKFKKVQADVMRMLITLERLKAETSPTESQDANAPTV
jgi:hypothetical protein